MMSSPTDLQKHFPIILDEKTGALLWKDPRSLKLEYLIPVSRLKKFLEGLSKGELYGTRCSKCGSRYFPPRLECSRCGSGEVEWIRVAEKGRLLAYTIVNVKPESYQKFGDYIVGIAEMEDGFRVLAWIKSNEPNKLRRGMPVKLIFSKREDGLTSYYLAPLE